MQKDSECEKCNVVKLKESIKTLAARLMGSKAPSSKDAKGPSFVETPSPAVIGGKDESGIEEVKPTLQSEGASGPAGIYITSDPSGAEVYLGDILAGTTEPAFQKLNMTPNTTVRVTLKKPEHHDLTFDVELRPGISKYERLKLKPAFGYLTVEGEPSDAEVYIGSNLAGNIPIKSKKLKSGKHLISVRKKLYETIDNLVVEIKDGETAIQKISLKQAYGTLSIDSSPKGASVAIDGEVIGKTPIDRHKISPGNYTLKIAQDGYTEKEFKIKVAVGAELKITPEQANLRKKIFNLQVFADPPEPDSEVYVDGEKKGTAPVTIEGLSEGKHTVEVKTKEKSGKEEIIGRDGETKTAAIKLTLSKLPPLTKGGEGGLGMVFIKGGCYQMGDTFGDGESDEKPIHEVCVDDFYMGKYEVTQKEWTAVMGNNPSNFKNCDNCPVEEVSWDDAQDFINKLNVKSPFGKGGQGGFRLPTEAEWEYAARSGGESEKYSGGNNIDSVGWYSSNSNSKTHPVGQKEANGLGLYDMTGNVWEWVQDWYDSDYYRKSPKNNPKGPDRGQYRVLRGGSWGSNAWVTRASYRVRDLPADRYYSAGFRVVVSSVRQ